MKKNIKDSIFNLKKKANGFEDMWLKAKCLSNTIMFVYLQLIKVPITWVMAQTVGTVAAQGVVSNE